MAECARPSFGDFDNLERKNLKQRLDALRAVLRHSGEKGRALEAEAMSLLRDFLPSEYGLSTGFVAYHEEDGPRLTSQLDIIIYDAVRGAPMARFGTCDVFPLEAVYGYVEVKASLSASKLDDLVRKNAELREIKRRQYWRPVKDTTTVAESVAVEPPSMRAYVFAFEYKGSEGPEAIARRLADVAKETGSAHLHGVLLANVGFFSHHAVENRSDPKLHSVNYVVENRLSHFKWALVHKLARCWRHPADWFPALDQYHLSSADVKTEKPSDAEAQGL